MRIALILLLLPVLSWAESDHQAWNSIALTSSFSKFDIGVEIENRTSESGSSSNINQIKPELFYSLSVGKIGFIYTLESGDSFKIKTENRYSFVYDIESYKNDVVVIQTRFRQEFRNFADQNKLAYRFRLRNNLSLKQKLYWSLKPSINSEWRVYQEDSAGKAIKNFSHRAILNFSKSIGQYELNIHYTHNYQKEDARDQNTHAFGLGLKIDI